MKCREKVERRTTASVGIAYSVLCAGRVPGVWAGDLAGCDDAARPPAAGGVYRGGYAMEREMLQTDSAGFTGGLQAHASGAAVRCVRSEGAEERECRKEVRWCC